MTKNILKALKCGLDTVLYWTLCPLIATLTGDRGAFQLSFYFAKTMSNELKGDKVTMGLCVSEATVSGQWANKFWSGVACAKSNNQVILTTASITFHMIFLHCKSLRGFFFLFPSALFFFFFNLRSIGYGQKEQHMPGPALMPWLAANHP